MTSLKAAQSGESAVRLTWTTASEINNAGFALRHKASSKGSWSKLGFVESNAAGGTTTEAQTCRFKAEDLSVGTHQFRLKQRDLSGAEHVHDPVTAELQMKEAVQLSAPAPNPVQDRATLSFAVKEQAKRTVTLYSMLGQRVRTVYQGTPTPGKAQTARLSTDGWSSGVYVLRLRADGRTKVRRVTVVR